MQYNLQSNLQKSQDAMLAVKVYKLGHVGWASNYLLQWTNKRA